MNQEEKIAFVEASLFNCVDERPGSIVIQKPNWVQVITPTDPSLLNNAVYRSVLTTEEAEARVQETIAIYQKNKSIFRWVISPITRPTNLPDILLQHGMTLSHHVAGMFSMIDRLPPTSDSPVHLARVTNKNVMDCVQVNCRAFPGLLMPPELLKSRFLFDSTVKPQTTFHFTGYVGSTPVAALSYKHCGDFAYISGGCVDPNHRGKGYMKALGILVAKHAMEHHNIHVFVTQALKGVSEPIAHKFGFESVCNTDIYLYKSQLEAQ